MSLTSNPPELSDLPTTSWQEAETVTRAIRYEGTDASASTATSYFMNVGDSFYGSRSSAGDMDWVRVSLTAGTYVVTLDGRGANGMYDPYLRVMDVFGDVVTFNDDSGGSLNSRLVLTVSSGGTYYLSAGAFNWSDSGDYSLAIARYTPPAAWTMAEIAEQLTDGYWESVGASARAFDVNQGGSLNVDLSGLTAAGRNLANSALSVWESVLGITFNRNPGAGATIQITFDDNDDDAYSTSEVFGGYIESSHVNISTSWLVDNGTGFNTYSYQTYIHEIGHALGLGHAGDYNGFATYGIDNEYPNDSWQATVMSYFSQTDNTSIDASHAYVVSAMMADIVAMQDLYGISGIRSGNNTYGETTNAGAAYTKIANMLSNTSTRNDITFTIFDQGGFDTLDLRQDSNNQRINLAPGGISNAYGLIGNISIAQGTMIEAVLAGRGSDVVFGNAAHNRLDGGMGNDTLTGGLGNDTLLGGLGADRMVCRAGNDVYFVERTSDVVVEVAGGGIDTIYTTLSMQLGANIENLSLNSGGVQNGTGNALANQLDGNNAANTLNGAAGNDTLIGNAGHDRLLGGIGADLLNGGLGYDTLYGGAGNDVFITDGQDTIVEVAGGGLDTVYSTGNLVLGANLENVGLIGSGTNVQGNALANRITGSDVANRLFGNGGNDTLLGGAGNDFLNGGAGRDLIYGGAGNDVIVTDGLDTIIEAANGGTDTVRSTASIALAANIENLVMIGAGAQNGFGNALNNRITGNDSSNFVSGNLGNDILTGRGGADSFVFNAGRDIITDFQNDVDTIRIDDALWGGTARSVAQLIADAEVFDGNTRFDFGGGNILWVLGVSNAASLQDDLVIV